MAKYPEKNKEPKSKPEKPVGRGYTKQTGNQEATGWNNKQGSKRLSNFGKGRSYGET